MKTVTRKTDRRGRLTLPSDFASCVVIIERDGDELRVRKAQSVSFKSLMAKVTKKNLHAEVKTGPARGNEVRSRVQGEHPA